ncbi:hypothetical protein K443DRAFT_600895 [Laccaria amethystina LaAM-08-1]|uniref:peptidylprolyl isomerase n=1 Tax=Laccaria amethystina LaAM-08-1 TaxID=1095629 RepID=A0A0C9WKY9_9AGAR|nr:hypothetical protein K443DRAFT_600895 [Laccaria amethystina LaAM-08-1]
MHPGRITTGKVRTRLTRWQIHKRHADTPINLLARTCRIAWRLGAGRLPLSPISFCFRSTTGHKYICPKAIHDPEIVEECSKDYIYFPCIAFINSVRLSPSSLSTVDVISLIQIKTAYL